MFQGDPKIYLNANGAYLDFSGGQPEMDQGLENLVAISLFTEEGWPGNLLFKASAEKIGSGFLEAARLPINVTNLNILRQSVLTALNNSIFGDIEVDVENVSGNNRSVKILIKPPSSAEVVILLLQNGINWIMQRDK